MEILPPDLEMRILLALQNEQMRNREIVSLLWEEQKKQDKHPPHRKRSKDSDAFRAFKVRVTKKLLAMTKQGLLTRDQPRHRKVSYSITKDGRQRLSRFLLEKLVSLMRPIEVQVLMTLTHLLISIVYIVAPHEATLEDYINLLRDQFNREDILELAKDLMNDPQKQYAQFYEHIKKFENKIILKMDS